VFFPLPHPERWQITWVEAHQSDERHEFAYTFRVLEKQ